MTKSVIQDEKVCFICGTTYNLELHHIYRGAYRKASDRYGLVVWLCNPHHTGNQGVHNGNVIVDKYLKQLGQRKFEENHSREEFIRHFGHSYL